MYLRDIQSARRRPKDKFMISRLIRFWFLCSLAFASPAIVLAFMIRPIDSAFLISAMCLVGVLLGPFAMIVASIADMTLDLVAIAAIVCGIVMVVAFWRFARRDEPATILKAIIGAWCFLGFALSIVPAIIGIT